MNQTNEIANATVIYGVPINYKDEVYQHAIDFWTTLGVSVHNIYDVYFLIEKVFTRKEWKLWNLHERVIILFPMTLFSTPSFLHDYLEQLSRMFSKQPLEKTKEIQLFITIEEDESLYTKNGLYHTTVIELIWFLKIWSDSLNLKFLVPEILFNFADDEISSDTIKSAAARCLILNRPYIKTIATENGGKTEYINKVVTE